ncbi:hypothetical protein CEY16_04585 [Halalkalibacillus sediminis]|uniref:Uncharacterized protein n=1 Tax=Halalkalibacillus sediminis TaxID=2018042 RepID=A0A2I0QXG7_9BACI|nr:nodulation protein NfeD [Halalkalibacillus sediminis]PKR79032.1 hypothetical protein CEY16_04585 [Halalkalibacillus sediminis]
MKKKLYIFLIFALSFIWINQAGVTADNHESSTDVYVIPIENEVERGLVAFLERSIQEAEEAYADYIVFEINSPGGRVDSAEEIATLISSVEIPNAAYIINQALSAGSYIALNAQEIYFRPGATMGASGVIVGDGTAADEKAQSAWIAAMTAAAEQNDRDPLYAEAMANPDLDLSEYRAGEGDYLTLRADEALEVGYSEGTAENRAELFEMLDIKNPQVVETELTFSEHIARFVTSPVVIPILLSVASLGLIVELYSPGFGIPGIMGLSALLLFFYGHLIAGFAGYESIILFILGIVLIVLEIFVPSGILGVIGGGAILGAMLVAGADLGYMAFSIGIALLIALVGIFILFRKLDFNKGIFGKIVLTDQTTTDLGYVSNSNRMELIGKEGEALTYLRPAGTAVIDDERLDVVSEGGFIAAGTKIKVVKVEGSRIVVREVHDK